MQVHVDYVNPPKAGKKSGNIKCGDKTYFFDPMKLSFTAGSDYDIEVKGSEYNGNMMYFVQSSKPVAGAAATSGNGAATSHSDRWWQPVVSNWVAHAIASGQITDPSMMKLWGTAAKEAIFDIDQTVIDQQPDF